MFQLFTQDYTEYQVYSVVNKSDKSLDDVLENSEKLGKKNAATMKIEYAKDNNTTFAYFPYYSKLSNKSMGTLMLDHDRGFRRSDDVKSYEITTQKTDRETSYMMGEMRTCSRKDMSHIMNRVTRTARMVHSTVEICFFIIWKTDLTK